VGKEIEHVAGEVVDPASAARFYTSHTPSDAGRATRFSAAITELPGKQPVIVRIDHICPSRSITVWQVFPDFPYPHPRFERPGSPVTCQKTMQVCEVVHPNDTQRSVRLSVAAPPRKCCNRSFADLARRSSTSGSCPDTAMAPGRLISVTDWNFESFVKRAWIGHGFRQNLS
jgi:hypothetical protein